MDEGAPRDELERALRLLSLRSSREATGLFAGHYRSAFRGGGLEFEESRPYVPGDDVRSIDWNATARAGEPFVKLFREERDQTLVFLLDVSASMAFGSVRRSKAETAVHALALLSAAAERAGDRCGLVTFADEPRRLLPVGRGAGRSFALMREAAGAAARCSGPTRLERGLRAARALCARRSVWILLSDLRDPGLVARGAAAAPLRAALADLGRRHELVAIGIVDPREEELPAVGPVRVRDSEQPGRLLRLDTGRRRVRERYRQAARRWRSGVERELRAAGVEALWLRSDASPLRELGRFFQRRARRRRT